MTTAPAPGDAIDSDFTGPLGAALGAWADWSASFILLGEGTNPTLGNSTVLARYHRIGKAVRSIFVLTIGSSFNPGNPTNYQWPVPVPAAGSFAAAVGAASVRSNGSWRPCVISGLGSNPGALYIVTPSGALLGSGGGGLAAWTTGDIVKASITYEAA